MDAAELAYQRGRKLAEERFVAFSATQVLAVLDALICLAILVVGGLLAGLYVTRGVAHLDPARLKAPPAWLVTRLGNQTEITQPTWIGDTGLTPLVVANRGAGSSLVHRGLARALGGFVASIKPLQSNRGAIAVLLALMLSLLLALLVVNRWRRRLSIALAADAASSLRRQLHRQIYRLGLSALPNQGIGPVLNLFTREVNDVRDGLQADLERRLRTPVLIAGSLLIALLISVPLTLFMLSLLGVSVLIARPLLRSARRESDEAARDAAVQLCLLHEDLGLVRTVRVYGIESVDKNRFDEHLDLYQKADQRRMRSEGLVTPMLLLVIGSGIAATLALAGFVVLAPERYNLSLAAILMVAAVIGGLIHFVPAWYNQRHARRLAGRSADSVFEYLDIKPELTIGVGARFLPPIKDRITFENVTLQDPSGSGRLILDGVSAEIQAETRTAIMGLDEASKQALLCLIPRLIDPSSGRVRIDGIALKDVTLESLRAQLALVLQADLVFSDTVSANIGLGDTSLSLPRIIQAAKTTHAHHFIQDLPDGYDTVIGPLGYPLRVDEQYRIALARAILHDPAILIIEEPKSSVDESVAPLIDDAIDRVAQNRTVIFLPSRLGTVRNCDQALLLHKGRVAAAGPPRKLFAENKLYRHIQFTQFNRLATTSEVEAAAADAL